MPGSQSAPPQLSPDGLWWWTGAAWVPAAEPRTPPGAVPAQAQPGVVPGWAAYSTPAVAGQPHGAGHGPGPSPAPGAWPAQPGPPPAPTTTFDILCMVCGLVGFTLLSVPLAFVFGVLSRRRSRAAGQSASVLTVVGMTFAALWSVPVGAAIAIPVYLNHSSASSMRDALAVVSADLRAGAPRPMQVGPLARGSRPDVQLFVMKVSDNDTCIAAAHRNGRFLTLHTATGQVSDRRC